MSENVEITLNGVNVSGCKYLYNSKDGLLCTLYDYNVFYDMRCSDNPDCYYKQLQRAKAQYDEVVKQNKSLQAERENLKSENKKLAKDNNVLTKTLKEIEEYINNFCDNCDWDETDIDCASSCRLDEITNPISEKIKEVENGK